METILTLTMNPTIDINTSVNQVVAEDKLRCQNPRREPGGGGLNVSRAIKKLGGSSIAFYLAGGLNGQVLQKLLDQETLNHRPIAIQQDTRDSFIVFEESTEKQYRFSMPGPTLAPHEWEKCLDEIENLNPAPKYIVGSGSLPPGVPDDFYAYLARLGRKIGAKVIIDTTGTPLQLAAKEGIFLVKPNMRELKDLFKQDITDEAQLKELAIKFINETKTEVIVVSLGAAGALMVTKNGTEILRTPTVPIKSKVGAGDSMVAGIVLSLAKGDTISYAVRYGVASGAAAVMTPGTELCRKKDADRLVRLI